MLRLSYSIIKNDIDSFLGESNRGKIHRKLVIASTDGIALHCPQEKRICADLEFEAKLKLLKLVQ